MAIREPDGPIEGDPTHQPAICEILPTSSGLPDALLGLVPVVGEPPENVAHLSPTAVTDLESVRGTEVEAVNCLPIDGELELIRGPISDSHRTGSAVALPMFQDFFAQIAGTV